MSLDKVFQTLEMHPKYLDAFLNVHQSLLRGDGPLRYDERLYIAMMASSRHRCKELVEHYRSEYEEVAELPKDVTPGHPKYVGHKLLKLDTVNKVLAHKPWTLTYKEIRDLIRSKDGANLSMSQLVHAIILLSHFHSFAAFVQGCARFQGLTSTSASCHKRVSSIEVNDEQDFIIIGGESASDEGSLDETDDNTEEEAGEVPLILKKMETLSANKPTLEGAELARRFEQVDDEAAAAAAAAAAEAANSRKEGRDKNGMTWFSKDLDYKYEDFLKRPNPAQFPTVRSNELSWTDQGFSTVRSFYSEEMSQFLDAKFNIIRDLTYMNIGRYTSVDTSMFRTAVQYYVQCLYGIRHDDYDYAEVNELIPRPLKKYIKTISCFPEQCTLDEYSNIMTEFLESEKISCQDKRGEEGSPLKALNSSLYKIRHMPATVHVALLVCEARFESTLCYASRAINEHFVRN